MKTPASIAVLLALAACTRPAERVAVAPAVAVVEAVEPSPSAGNPLVAGADLPPDRTIAANLAAAPMLSTLTRAAAASGQTAPLEAARAMTLFAPTDEAFGRLAPGTVEALMKPENRGPLTRLVTLHLVSGRHSSADLIRRIRAGNGTATLTTVAGEPLTLTLTGAIVTLTDAGGNKSYVEVADVRETNGVMHIVNGVLVPRLP